MRCKLLPILSGSLTALLLAACAGGSSSELSSATAPNEPGAAFEAPTGYQGGLPAPGELSGLPAFGRHRVSATSFELLDSSPLSTSPNGSAVAAPGQLELDFQLVGGPGPAYAIYSLPGLPTDGSIVPTQLDIDKTGLGWVAVANFALNKWEFSKFLSTGQVSLASGADYVSPGGYFYAAVLAYPIGPNPLGQISCTSLLAQFSGDLPAGPSAVLDVLTPSPQNNAPVRFKHWNSQPGDGSFTLFTYDFGDGSALFSTADFNAEVEHTYANPGDYTVLLTVEALVSGSPMSAYAQQLITVILEGPPTAALRVVGTRHAVKFPVRMDAALSDPGLGTYTSIDYDFGDTQTYSTQDPFEVVEHIYALPGLYTITLTVNTDQGGTPRQDVDSTDANLADTIKEVLVVYNSSIPESDDLRSYYCIPETGRGIDPDYQLGIGLGGDGNEVMDRANFDTNVREIIKLFIDSKGQQYKDTLKYILLCKGIPHKINGANGGDYTQSTYSAVDSELCTLYSDGTYSYASFLWNESSWQAFGGASDSFYMGVNDGPLSRDYNFVHGAYKVTDSLGNEYPLDYLVGRLSGYTYDDAKALVDRSIAAEQTSAAAGWVIMDTIPARTVYDTMADPVWPDTQHNDLWLCGSDLLTSVGQNNYIDITNLCLTGQASDSMPANSVANVVAYAGWGVNHGGSGYPSGANYILNDLLFTWLPGAAWISYESFNGTTFTCSNPADPTVGHPGQGQICDFVRKGGSCAIGNCWEPWTLAVGDERVVQYRYVVEGDRWIEAAYKGLRCLSWMEVVVGDPLCQLGQ
jgi:uncharacterized protein (TIGR03790 family)